MRRLRQAHVGLIGEGQVLGMASGLFGLPEPFTAVANSETVEAYWISISDRPAASWPREIVKPLLTSIRMRTEYHERRARTLASKHEELESKGKGERRGHIGSLTDSPFLRNKNTSNLKERLHSRRFDGRTPDIR